MRFIATSILSGDLNTTIFAFLYVSIMFALRFHPDELHTWADRYNYPEEERFVQEVGSRMTDHSPLITTLEGD